MKAPSTPKIEETACRWSRLLAVVLLGTLAGCAGERASAQTEAAASVPTDTTVIPATQAGLTLAQAQRLAALDVPVAVPGLLPEGFTVDAIRTDPGINDDPTRGPTYTVRYDAPSGACFLIETATGGLGGPAPPENRRQLASPLFGTEAGRVPHVFWTEAVPARPHPPHSLFSSWLGQGRRFYRLTSGRMVPQACVRIAPVTAVRIVESLRWLEGTAPSATDSPTDSSPGLFDMAAYDIYVMNRPFAIKSQPGATPRAAALHVLEEVGLRAGPSASPAIRVQDPHRDTTAVLVTYTDLRDDSVAGARHLVQMYRTEGRWVLRRVGTQYRCQRGHPDWSKALCP